MSLQKGTARINPTLLDINPNLPRHKSQKMKIKGFFRRGNNWEWELPWILSTETPAEHCFPPILRNSPHFGGSNLRTELITPSPHRVTSLAPCHLPGAHLLRAEPQIHGGILSLNLLVCPHSTPTPLSHSPCHQCLPSAQAGLEFQILEFPEKYKGIEGVAKAAFPRSRGIFTEQIQGVSIPMDSHGAEHLFPP